MYNCVIWLHNSLTSVSDRFSLLHKLCSLLWILPIYVVSSEMWVLNYEKFPQKKKKSFPFSSGKVLNKTIDQETKKFFIFSSLDSTVRSTALASRASSVCVACILWDLMI